MTKPPDHHSRATLKAHFQAGSLPRQQHFESLIDSCLNLREDGFSRTDSDGWRVHSQAQHDGLFSFHRDTADSDPLWSAGFAKGGDQWVLRSGDATQPAVLTLDRQGRAGIGVSAPRATLDVNGPLRAAGRIGTPPKTRPPVADGRWHDITGDLHGCHAFEIMAGAGKPSDRNRFALMHATAMNCYHPIWWQNLLRDKRPIRAIHAHYARRRDRLDLRWWSPNDSHGVDAIYRLQVRSRCDYLGHERRRAGPGGLAPEQEVRLYVYLTPLWFQSRMEPLWESGGS
jgi:hypothetical protein